MYSLHQPLVVQMTQVATNGVDRNPELRRNLGSGYPPFGGDLLKQPGMTLVDQFHVRIHMHDHTRTCMFWLPNMH